MSYSLPPHQTPSVRAYIMDHFFSFPDPGSPQPNLPLLRKVIDFITAHPQEWDQRNFEGQGLCGTTRCVAGWVNYWDTGYARGDEYIVGDSNAPEHAARLLGLTTDEAYDLFFSTIGMPDELAALREVAERIAERAGEEL